MNTKQCLFEFVKYDEMCLYISYELRDKLFRINITFHYIYSVSIHREPT